MPSDFARRAPRSRRPSSSPSLRPRNHKNSSVKALLAVHEGGNRWRLSGGPGYTGWKAIEDNKWHKGKRIQSSSIGKGAIGENAINFWFDFDKGTVVEFKG